MYSSIDIRSEFVYNSNYVIEISEYTNIYKRNDVPWEMVKKGNNLTWTFQIILFIAFLFFGIAKFLIPPELAAGVFGKIGGTTSQYLTAAYQTTSAVLVIIPSLAFIGALLIIITMAVAIILHFTVLGFEGPFIFLTILAVVMIILAIYVMKQRRKDLFRKR